MQLHSGLQSIADYPYSTTMKSPKVGDSTNSWHNIQPLNKNAAAPNDLTAATSWLLQLKRQQKQLGLQSYLRSPKGHPQYRFQTPFTNNHPHKMLPKKTPQWNLQMIFIQTSPQNNLFCLIKNTLAKFYVFHLPCTKRDLWGGKERKAEIKMHCAASIWYPLHIYDMAFSLACPRHYLLSLAHGLIKCPVKWQLWHWHWHYLSSSDHRGSCSSDCFNKGCICILMGCVVVVGAIDSSRLPSHISLSA